MSVKNLDQEIQALYYKCRSFVKACAHLQERADRKGYEPNPDQSHYWAWLQGAVEHVKDAVKDVES